MTTPRIPGPPAYRRPEASAAPLPASTYASSPQLAQEPIGGPPPPIAPPDPEVLLQQWHIQQAQSQQLQMAPPPPPLHLHTLSSETAASSQRQPQQSVSPMSEAATPKSATKPPAAKKGKPTPTTTATTMRSSRRRKSAALTKDDSDGSVSEEFTMEGVKTKSGRKVHRPAHFNPAQKTPSRRRGPYRRNYDARICKLCQRGHSPQSNMIVFCDGCNAPFHQLCHDPPIDDLVIAIAEAEWYCANCARAREERPLTMGLAGDSLSVDEKRTYLASLPLASLLEIIFFCEKSHPELPIYDPQTKEIVDALVKKGAAAANRDAGEDGTPGVNGEAAQASGERPAAPNWEDMVVRAVSALPDGTAQPRTIYEWIRCNYPAFEDTDVRAEAPPYLQTALHNKRLLREGLIYRVNPNYKPPATTTSSSSAATATAAAARNHTDPAGFIAPGSGIKLPPETEDDEAMLVDDDHIAFSHRVWKQPLKLPPEEAAVMNSLAGGAGVGVGVGVLAHAANGVQ